jgi:phosphate starvation-inducible PhoH-like protein
MVINGDLSQVDLPLGQKSGLKEAHEILNNINAIKIVELGVEDVIRHPIVAQIIKAYDIKR